MFENAYSIENRSSHENAGQELQYAATIVRGNRKRIFYKDENGNYWYESRIITSSGKSVTEYEAIFGRKEKYIKK